MNVFGLQSMVHVPPSPTNDVSSISLHLFLMGSPSIAVVDVNADDLLGSGVLSTFTSAAFLLSPDALLPSVIEKQVLSYGTLLEAEANVITMPGGYHQRLFR